MRSRSMVQNAWTPSARTAIYIPTRANDFSAAGTGELLQRRSVNADAKKGAGRPTTAGRPNIVSIATDIPIGERELHQPLT